jgi:hypothetical protein
MDILRDIRNMEAASDCVVVYAERVGGDVIIEFNDGKCALYSASFLHSMLTQVTEMDASDSEEE